MIRAKHNFLIFILCTLLYPNLTGCQINSLTKIEKLLEGGIPQEAVEKLEIIIDKDPNNANARMLLGKGYNDLGRHNEAVLHFQKASQLYASEPKNLISARLELANTYLIYGDRDSAYRILNIVQKTTSDPKVINRIIELVGDSYTSKQLTTGDSDNYSPAFSPDGSQIAFASFRLENGEIYIMDLNGRIHRRVTYSTDFNDNSPAFLNSPDYIFYSSEPKSTREIKLVIQSSGSTPIYAGFNITHIHSKITHSVLPISFGARVPRTSPLGDIVVYESNTDGNLELYLIDLGNLDFTEYTIENINPQRITHNETDEGSPAFFPNGKTIIFVSSRNDFNQLYTIDIDGKNEKHFNPNRFDCYSPSVSPDGKKIVYMSARYGDWEIYLIDADGKNERQITSGIGRSIQPTFSPDGRYIAFVSDRSDNFHIYLMDLNKPTTREDLVKSLNF